jgi:hypothetical protein
MTASEGLDAPWLAGSSAPHLPSDPADVEMLGHNQLVIRVRPDEGLLGPSARGSRVRFGRLLATPFGRHVLGDRLRLESEVGRSRFLDGDGGC